MIPVCFGPVAAEVFECLSAEQDGVRGAIVPLVGRQDVGVVVRILGRCEPAATQIDDPVGTRRWRW